MIESDLVKFKRDSVSGVRKGTLGMIKKIYELKDDVLFVVVYKDKNKVKCVNVLESEFIIEMVGRIEC